MPKKTDTKVTAIEEARSSHFKPGDVVVLRSGSQTMVVEKATALSVTCLYIDRSEVLTRMVFIPATLESDIEHVKRQVSLRELTKSEPKDDKPVGDMTLVGPNGPVTAPPELQKMIEEFLFDD